MVHGRIGLIALAGAAAVATTASAGIVGDAVSITAVSAAGKTASWSISSVGATWTSDAATWMVDAPIDLRAGDGELVARLDSLQVTYIADPVVSVTFAMTAGAASTQFTMTSGLLSFASMNALARASAGVTVTDNNGNGASATGNLAGGALYRAHYNGAIPGGTQFAALLGTTTTTTSFGSATSSASSPGGPGYTPIGATTSMQSQFDFNVTPFDSASVTSVFVTVPGPGVAALGGLGLLAALRRRR